MIDGTYSVEVNTPFGSKTGMAVLRTEGSTLYIDIDAPVIGRRSVEGHVEGDSFTAEGSFKILLVGKIDYTLQGEVVGDVVKATLKSNKGDFTLEGVRV